MAILVNIVFLLLGAAIGFFCNVIVGWGFSYKQFLSSTASHRIEMVIKATRDIVAAPLNDHVKRGRLRDQYRYSLGVMIDELTKAFGRAETAFNTNGPWPLLVPYNEERPKDPMKDNNGEPLDRWRQFDRYVRPVVEDINPSSFLRHSWWLRRSKGRREKIDQLTALSALCDQLESTISLLDAALEKTPLVGFENTGTAYVIRPKTEFAGEITPLTQEFRKLHMAWKDWLSAS